MRTIRVRNYPVLSLGDPNRYSEFPEQFTPIDPDQIPPGSIVYFYRIRWERIKDMMTMQDLGKLKKIAKDLTGSGDEVFWYIGPEQLTLQ